MIDERFVARYILVPLIAILTIGACSDLLLYREHNSLSVMIIHDGSVFVMKSGVANKPNEGEGEIVPLFKLPSTEFDAWRITPVADECISYIKEITGYSLGRWKSLISPAVFEYSSTGKNWINAIVLNDEEYANFVDSITKTAKPGFEFGWFPLRNIKQNIDVDAGLIEFQQNQNLDMHKLNFNKALMKRLMESYHFKM